MTSRDELGTLSYVIFGHSNGGPIIEILNGKAGSMEIGGGGPLKTKSLASECVKRNSPRALHTVGIFPEAGRASIQIC